MSLIRHCSVFGKSIIRHLYIRVSTFYIFYAHWCRQKKRYVLRDTV